VNVAASMAGGIAAVAEMTSTGQAGSVPALPGFFSFGKLLRDL
jgi:hypothetical protein